MSSYRITLKDRSTEEIDGADAYQQEGQMTTFFQNGSGRQVVDTWSTRLASFRTTEILAIRRLEPVATASVGTSGPLSGFAPEVSPTPHRSRGEPAPMSLTDPVPEVQTFACPRCQAEVAEPWYGPCTACRTELRAVQVGEGRDVELAAYEPKMNVTPNAVATKD